VQGVRDDPAYSPQQQPEAMKAAPPMMDAPTGALSEELRRAFETAGMQHLPMKTSTQLPLAMPEYSGPPTPPRSATPPSQSNRTRSFQAPLPPAIAGVPAHVEPPTPPRPMTPSEISLTNQAPTPPQQISAQESYPPPTPPQPMVLNQSPTLQPLELSPSRPSSNGAPEVEQVDPGTFNISRREFKELFGQSPPPSGRYLTCGA